LILSTTDVNDCSIVAKSDMGKSGEKPFSVVALLIDSGNNKKKFEK